MKEAMYYKKVAIMKYTASYVHITVKSKKAT